MERDRSVIFFPFQDEPLLTGGGGRLLLEGIH